jgi:hypothetical protein
MMRGHYRARPVGGQLVSDDAQTGVDALVANQRVAHSAVGWT